MRSEKQLLRERCQQLQQDCIEQNRVAESLSYRMSVSIVLITAMFVNIVLITAMSVNIVLITAYEYCPYYSYVCYYCPRHSLCL